MARPYNVNFLALLFLDFFSFPASYLIKRLWAITFQSYPSEFAITFVSQLSNWCQNFYSVNYAAAVISRPHSSQPLSKWVLPLSSSGIPIQIKSIQMFSYCCSLIHHHRGLDSIRGTHSCTAHSVITPLKCNVNYTWLINRELKLANRVVWSSQWSSGFSGSSAHITAVSPDLTPSWMNEGQEEGVAQSRR